MKRLPRDFYSQDTVKVAKCLLGKILVRKIRDQILSGIIVETEAYRYLDDPASHAHNGITPRNHVMFGKVGYSYVYFTYGMHYCVNVVAYSPQMKAGAVLIRAIQPQKGISMMIKNRGKEDLKILANGPAKLTQAMNITNDQYGKDLTKDSEIFILDNNVKIKIISGKRIGIRLATEKMWNFKVAEFM